MTSVWKRFGLGLVVIATASVSASGAPQMAERDPLAPLPIPQQSAAPAYVPPAPASPAPIYLRNRVTELGRAFDGKAGVAIVSMRDGWEIGWNANSLFPQQSCSKLWVAITAMDAVDRGQISLNDKVTQIGRASCRERV